MKLIILSIFAGVFTVNTEKTKPANTLDKIFITSTDDSSGRTVMIEEDEYSIWVYVLKPNLQGIDFDGFLCAIVDPEALDISPKEATKNGNATPLTPNYANKHSYIKDISSNDIKVHWKHNRIEIKLKNETYLIMDLKSKTSYSKALAKDCYYGNAL